MQEREPREFHTPGTLTTWFARLLGRPSASVPVPAMSVDERREIIEALVRERARWESERHAHDRGLDSARTRVADSRALLRDAEAHLAELEGEALAVSGTHDARARQLEARLRAGASSHISIFVRDVRDQLEALRGPDVLQVVEQPGRPNAVDGRRERRVFSNSDSINTRRLALMAAAATAEALELEALTEEELIERLTALRDGIPRVEDVLVDGSVTILTPAERREVAWARGESA